MTERAARLTRFSLVAGPLLLLVYGSVRLLVEGSREPGAAWITGHFAFLFGLLFFGVICEGLRRTVAAGAGPVRRRMAAAGAVVALVGVAASTAQVVIDLYAGFRAADRPEMREIFARVQDVPGVLPVVYTVVPVFFYLGVITLLALLRGAAAVRSLVPFVLGTAAMAVDLDFLPIGGLCYLLAFVPLRRLITGPRAAGGADAAAA